jgi:hypothetical protein
MGSRGTPGAPRRQALIALLLAPALAWAGAKPGKPTVDGFWNAPGGRLAIKNKNGRVIAVVTADVDSLGLKKGDKVLDGTLDEDSVSGELRLGVAAPGCGAVDGTAYVVLLLTRSGKLTGGASAKAACATSLSSLTLLRPTDSESVPPVRAQASPAEYDPHGAGASTTDDGWKALMNDGRQYSEEGNFEKARAQFEKAIAKNPARGEGYNGVGAMYALRNDYESAVEWYKKGLEAQPGFGDLYYNLACAYAQLEKASLALRYLKRSPTSTAITISTRSGARRSLHRSGR